MASFNPAMAGAVGPDRPVGLGELPPQIMELLQLLSQLGAAPAADSLARNRMEPSEDMLRRLIETLMRGGAQAPQQQAPDQTLASPTISGNRGLLEKLLDG